MIFCKNGGICVLVILGDDMFYICNCLLGYIGENCEGNIVIILIVNVNLKYYVC